MLFRSRRRPPPPPHHPNQRKSQLVPLHAVPRGRGGLSAAASSKANSVRAATKAAGAGMLLFSDAVIPEHTAVTAHQAAGQTQAARVRKVGSETAKLARARVRKVGSERSGRRGKEGMLVRRERDEKRRLERKKRGLWGGGGVQKEGR